MEQLPGAQVEDSQQFLCYFIVSDSTIRLKRPILHFDKLSVLPMDMILTSEAGEENSLPNGVLPHPCHGVIVSHSSSFPLISSNPNFQCQYAPLLLHDNRPGNVRIAAVAYQARVRRVADEIVRVPHERLAIPVVPVQGATLLVRLMKILM